MQIFHQQIIYCKFIFITEYPPSYERSLWEYNKASIKSIKQALNQVNWTALLSNKDVHQQVNVLNSIILNVFSNFSPNKIITVDDRGPPWMSEFIKSKIYCCNNSIYKKNQNSSRSAAEYDILQQAITEVSEMIYKKGNDCCNVIAKITCQNLQLVPKHTDLC